MSTPLADYLTGKLVETGLSESEVARRSKGGITQSHVNRIKNGISTNLSLAKIRALALGLGVPESELLAIARGVSPDNGELKHDRLREMDFAYEGMSDEAKEEADFLIEMFEREFKRLEQKDSVKHGK